MPRRGLSVRGRGFERDGAIVTIGRRELGRRIACDSCVTHHPGLGVPSVFIMIGWPTRDLVGVFSQVEVAGRVESPYAMPAETQWPIHVCRGPKLPFDQAWRSGKLFI